MSALLEFLLHSSPQQRENLIESLNQAERNEWQYDWPFWAHEGQLPPGGDWRIWLIMAGRGFGKTRAGAEWVRMVAEADGEARIALVGASLTEARSIMVEGESGILACCNPAQMPVYEPSLRRLRFPSGAQAQLFSAAEPESLRGPQHSHAWCDEIAKWNNTNGRAMNCWDNLLMGLRLGAKPQITATTTPRAVPLLRRLLEQDKSGDLVLTKGTTRDNAGNLPRRFIEAVENEFGDSLLGRQEIDGELIEEAEGALWTRALLEGCREERSFASHRRIVIGVDPPISSSGDACGIVVAALGEDGIARVLADASIETPTPEEWARRVAETWRAWQADKIIAEANQGGAMVESVLRAAELALPVKLVHASRGKAARAEPVAALYEAGRVRHLGVFARLEDELCALVTGGTYQGPGRSPDRADALVWALHELMLTKTQAPQVRSLD
jgi:phage terminase large subunit-like protein